MSCCYFYHHYNGDDDDDNNYYPEYYYYARTNVRFGKTKLLALVQLQAQEQAFN